MYGIFAISAATLLLEIAFTRLFSAMFFYHFSFLMISTGLFGFGVSGVFLSFLGSRFPAAERLAGVSCLLFALAVPLTLKVVLALPLDMNRELGSLWDAASLGVRYLFLALPFFFSGTAIGALLSAPSQNVSRLYFWDLAGASAGCLLPVIAVPWLGAAGTILAGGAVGASASIFFSWKGRNRATVALAGIVLAAGLVAVLSSSSLFAIPLDRVMASKNPGLYRRSTGVEFSGWSPISRIDILTQRNRKVLFIDGGSNVSFLLPFNGDWSTTGPRSHWRSLPYLLKEHARVLIIGPSGGEDVFTALSHGARSITGVELDPLINRLVTHRYNAYIGGIYLDPRVRLVTDEGRSFLRRSQDQYDVIQQVHNISPVALDTGAMNLSESYLLTEEAMGDYLDHLSADGVLCINRWGTIRIASIAIAVMEKRGIRDPGRHLAILESGENRGNTNYFLLKKSPLTDREVKMIRSFAGSYAYRVSYLPEESPPPPDAGNPYVRMLTPDSRRRLFREIGLNLFPPTDDRPFFDHFLPFGRRPPADDAGRGRDIAGALAFMNSGDYVVLGVLVESIVFSTLLLLLPLWLLTGRRKGPVAAGQATSAKLAYFFSLGMGFILIEVALIQKFVLFLGNPAYSLATVLFALLASAGIGSRWSERLAQLVRRPGRAVTPVACAAVAVCAILFLVLLGPIIRATIATPFAVRFLLTVLLLFCAGVFMGMPFPLAIANLQRRDPAFIPWAWGINGYATVIGSAACVILALTAGFKAVLAVAAGFYLLAAFCSQTRRSLLGGDADPKPAAPAEGVASTPVRR